MKTLCLLLFSIVLQNDWVTFSTKDCTVLFPKKPTDTEQTTSSAIGPLKMHLHLYEVPDGGQLDDNMFYGLITSEYPDSVINSGMKDKLDKFFAGSSEGAASNIHGKLVSSKVIQLNGYPGREIKVDGADGSYVVHMRSYLVKNVMYILEVITATPKEGNASIGRFMNSFGLK